MRGIGAAGLAAAAALGCAAPPDATVELTDIAVVLDPAGMAPGHHVFKIHNGGTVMHELEVIRTDLPAGSLPYAVGTARVRASDVAGIAEKENIAPGATKRLAADLAPGRYVLLCNVPGHYAVGMRTAFVVR